MHEVGMVREAAFSIEVEQEDMNEDENDEDLKEHEDLSPPNSRDEEVCGETRALTIRYDPRCDHRELQFQIEEFLPKIRANLKYTAVQLQADAMEMWGLTLNKRTCYRAIARALKTIRVHLPSNISYWHLIKLN
ncbi:hypothetical protein NL676_035000 [Syzygium grande]|nr:hypothetical protein NL676_035000 [Syzygium grande]